MMVEISLATKSKKLQKNVYLKMLKLSLGLCQKGNIELEGEQKKKYTDAFKSGGNILDQSASKC